MPAVDENTRARPEPEASKDPTVHVAPASVTQIMEPVGSRRATDPWDEPLFTSAACAGGRHRLIPARRERVEHSLKIR